MPYKNKDLLQLIPGIDLGSSVAELDTLLETARVETSVFNDLFYDRVDLIPGTKGSGKTALFRIFVEFLHDVLLEQKKVVIAHGIDQYGDSIFHAYKKHFEKLDEDDFVNFWCIYMISLINEQFLKLPRYSKLLKVCDQEIKQFRHVSQEAGIPDIKKQLTFKDVLGWTLAALAKISPKIKYKIPEYPGELELSLFNGLQESKVKPTSEIETNLPRYAERIKKNLEIILNKADLNTWLMIDRLDELFPRRSELERKALRGLLRTMRIFTSDKIRMKVFLRDDILSQVVSGGEGFTALTHITARQADTLRWSEDQILTMVIKRLMANKALRTFLSAETAKLDASLEYRQEIFYKILPTQVFRGTRQSSTMRWIYSHTADGNGVVTPRDVIELLGKSIQNQHDLLISNPSGESSSIISSQAIQYGFSELSKRKRITYLEAEFPHLWQYIEKFIGSKTDYTENALKSLFGKNWNNITKDLLSIGLMYRTKNGEDSIFSIPFVYRIGLELTQGRAE